MPYGAETYLTDVKPVLLDWLTNSRRGQNVTDLALSLTNRALCSLWQIRPWTKLTEKQTLSLTNNATSLPSDFGRLVEMYGSLNASGVPSYWYYEIDKEDGYVIDWNFSKDTGFDSPTLTFYYAQPTAVVMRYQKVLTDLTGEGDEYLFFPSELILLEAQRINTREKGNNKEWSMIKADHAEALNRYINSNQWVQYGALGQVNDRQGNRVSTQNISLRGDTARRYTSYPNAYIL